MKFARRSILVQYALYRCSHDFVYGTSTINNHDKKSQLLYFLFLFFLWTIHFRQEDLSCTIQYYFLLSLTSSRTPSLPPGKGTFGGKRSGTSKSPTAIKGCSNWTFCASSWIPSCRFTCNSECRHVSLPKSNKIKQNTADVEMTYTSLSANTYLRNDCLNRHWSSDGVTLVRCVNPDALQAFKAGTEKLPQLAWKAWQIVASA